MSEGIRTLIYPVRNVEQTKSLLALALGAEPYVDTPYYVGFQSNGFKVGLDPNGHRGRSQCEEPARTAPEGC